MGRPRSVIAQGSTPAPIRRSLRLSSKTRRDGIAKCMKLNTQNKENIKNAILLESSPLRPRSVIPQSSTPAPMDHVVNDDDEIKRLKNRTSREPLTEQRKYEITKQLELKLQNKKNTKNATLLKSSPLRSCSVIAQGSTPAPIDHVVYDDETKRFIFRTAFKIMRKIKKDMTMTMPRIRDDIAESIKLSTQNEINIENATLLESSSLRPRSVIAQSSTPAPMDHVVNDDKTKNFTQLSQIFYRELKLLNKQKEKNIKIATQMIMKRVNDDCLAEIFMYVPACERPKIALVCKKWKRALDYSWFNVKKLELTYWRYHELPCCLKKYQAVDEKLNFLKSLLDKCGRYLKTLDLTAYDRCSIVTIINDYCPNLEKLRLRFISIDESMLTNAFTRLSKLKSLTIIFQNMKGKSIPVTLINSLRNVAGALTELNLLNFVSHLDETCDYPKEFDCVIRELKVMKKFEVAGIRDSKNVFEYLKNNEMSFYFNHNEYLKKPPHLGDSFINISSLNLTSCFIKDDTLYTIANTIEKLETLTIICAQITDDGVVALSMMNYLQTLYLNGHNNVIDSSIKLLRNIVKLSLPRSNKITDVSVTKLLENSLKIKCLLLHYTCLTANFVKKAAEISSQRKQLLKISINSLIPDVKQYESPYFKIHIIGDKKK